MTKKNLKLKNIQNTTFSQNYIKLGGVAGVRPADESVSGVKGSHSNETKDN